MEVRRSVFLYGTWQLSHAEVPTYRCASWSRTAPAPIAAAVVSPVPATTSALVLKPRSVAACAVSGPTTEAGASSSGSLAASRPHWRTSAASQCTAPASRLSVHQRSTAVSYAAAARPVARSVRYSGTSSRCAAAAYASGRSCLRKRAWPTGSLPVSVGAPPVLVSQERSFHALYPVPGTVGAPPATARL